MSEPVPPQRRRILLKLFLGFSVFVLIVFALLAWYVTTDSFQQRARQRVIEAAEKMTGGRVELGELHTIPFRLRIDARNLTIHGREATDQAPFLHVDRIQAELKIISLLSTTIGLHALELDHPVAHVIVYPDGSTSVPVPKGGPEAVELPVERLLSLAISHFVVEDGQILWEDQKIPVALDAHNLNVLLSYSLLHRHYEAHIDATNIQTRYSTYPQFSWNADTNLILARSRIEITKLALNSGKTQLFFAGHLEDFHNPKLNGSYHGSTDLAELGPLVKQPQLKKGTVQFDGKGMWSLDDFSTDGSIQARDLDWSSGKVVLRNGRASAAFAMSRDRFRLTQIRANLLGGDLTGDADITNWQSSPELSPATKPRRKTNVSSTETRFSVAPARGIARLQLSAFPLAPVLPWFSSPKLPLDRLALVGNASGAIELTWIGSIQDAEARLKLEIVSANNANGNPVHGSIDGVYHASRDELSLKNLQLDTPATELTASGELAANSSLHFAITTHNLRELTPFIEARYGSHSLPVTLHGWASLAGNAAGKLSNLSVNGNLEVYDFDTIIPATSRTASRPIHWDAATAAIQYSNSHFSAHNGTLIHQHSVAHLDASLALDDGDFSEDEPFTLHFDGRNADLSELAQVAGTSYPLHGNLDFSLTASGTVSNPHGDGHLEIRNASTNAADIPHLSGDLRIAENEVQLNNLDATINGAAVAGAGTIEASLSDLLKNDWQSEQFHLNLSGRDLLLSRISRLQNGRVPVDGAVDFSLQASGTADQPSVTGSLHVKDFALAGERFGNFNIDAVTRGRTLDLKAHSDFQQADLTVTGNIELQNDYPADLNLTFRHFDAGWLLRTYWPGKVTGQSPLDGSLQLRGPLRTPRNLKASAELQAFGIEIDHVPVQSTGPVRIELVDQALLIESLHLTGSGTDFTAHGKAQISGEQALDLSVEGSVSMTLFQILNPKISARGSMAVSLTADGTIAHPVLQGRLDVKNTFISHNDFPSGLSDLNGVLRFDRSRIEIESLKGTTGGGNIALTGSATYENGTFLLDFGATAQDVRLRYPPGVSSTANADLRLTGTSNSAVLSGNVVVTKLAVTPGFDFGGYIERSRQSVVLTQNDSLESRLKLDVHVVTTPELEMQTAIARLSGDADLRLRGTAERPIILGRAEVLEGEISFNGTKYNLERGDVTFANPAKTQPVIDLRATTRVRDYDITVQFRGDASVPNGLKVTWQSEPQLPETDVIALLALGRTQGESAVASTNSSAFGFGGDASNLLINQALNSTVNSRLQRLFGVSHVKLDPQGLNSETSVVRGPQVTVEQQVSSNVTLTYSTNVSVSNQQIIQAEYNITRSISIVALRDQNGVLSFDLRIRRHRK